MSEMNLDGNIEVYPGPPGYSVEKAEQVSETQFRLVTNEPRALNPITMPRGPKGTPGVKGDPGQASIRVDETVGYRVFLWEIAVPSEQMVYGDTGVRAVDGGTVRRVNNTIYTTVTDPTTLPAGFKPDAGGSGTMFFTAEPWPTTLPDTKVTDPTRLKGLEGYDAATANGYPGTPESWLNDRYLVLQDPAGATLGQVYTRTETGAGWRNLPQIGPEPWRNITLDKTWSTSSAFGNLAQVRQNSGSVEFYGYVRYVGPEADVGLFSTDAVRIGVLPPDAAPVHNLELVCTLYVKGYQVPPIPARLNITSQGVMRVMAFSDFAVHKTVTLTPSGSALNLTGLQYATRTQ